MEIPPPKFRVELVVKNKSHFYDVFDGETKLHRFAGVTGYLGIINKPAILVWAKKEALASVERALLSRIGKSVTLDLDWIAQVLVDAARRPDDIKDSAADVGTRVHAAIDLIVHGASPSEMVVLPDMVSSVQAFYAWWKQSGIELVAGDTKVASLKYRYGGSLDALGRRNGKFILLDWKTSNNVYKEMAFQVAAYVQALDETHAIRCDEAVVVRFGKKLPITFESKKLCDLERSFAGFLHAKALKENLSSEHFE